MVGAKEAQITSFYPYPSIGPEVVNINRFVGLTLRRADVTGQLIKIELFKIIRYTRETNLATAGQVVRVKSASIHAH